jgi:putative acetyltransferase
VTPATPAGVRIRAERPADLAAVDRVLRAAFPTPAEAALVEALRGRTTPQISLVAEREGAGVVGHILFTPVGIGEPEAPVLALGLAPVAVQPEHQAAGIGTALIEAGLRACSEVGAALVVVLGRADYYPRFGFAPAWERGLYYGTPGPNPAFMVQGLIPGGLDGVDGEVRYHPAFDGL